MAAVIDVDSHVYETPEIWDRYVPSEYRGMARSAFYHEVDQDGNRLTILNGTLGRDLNRSRLVRQAIWRPGMTVDTIGQLDPDVFVALNPGATDPTARLADMDAMGIDQAVLFPTLFAEYLPLVENPDAAAILARGYNDWIWDFAQAGRGRLHPVALLPMHATLLAQRELDRVVEKGFRAVMIRPAFYNTPTIEEHTPEAEMQRLMRQMAAAASGGANQGSRVFIEDAPYRPLWRHIDELGIVACVHPTLGIAGPDAVSSGGFAERVAERLGARHSVAEPIAYMQDADLFMTAAFFHGLLEDHPALRLAILHSGATWVPLALEKCETYLWLSPQFGRNVVSLEPEEVWERHPVLVSFDGWERPVALMPDRLGSKAAWGSRYPQHDTSSPAEAHDMLEAEGVDSATIDRLLGGHAADIFHLDVAAAV
ncbi:MAG TPA: amidohydrolase family protein [Acidimicrobiales bacterium]|nr:amidohydrolase family protein [Acidimicrobiales bacterium]